MHREKDAAKLPEKLYQLGFLTEPEREYWDRFWERQMNTDWEATAGAWVVRGCA